MQLLTHYQLNATAILLLNATVTSVSTLCLQNYRNASFLRIESWLDFKPLAKNTLCQYMCVCCLPQLGSTQFHAPIIWSALG